MYPLMTPLIAFAAPWFGDADDATAVAFNARSGVDGNVNNALPPAYTVEL